MYFHLDDDEEAVIRKVRFCDLLEMLKGERSKNPRRKLFETHLLMRPENQKKITEADEVSTCISLSNSARVAFMSSVFHSFSFLPIHGLPGIGFIVPNATLPWPLPLPSPPPPLPLPLPDIMKLKKKTNMFIKRAKHEYKRGNTIKNVKEMIFSTHESANVSLGAHFT